MTALIIRKTYNKEKSIHLKNNIYIYLCKGKTVLTSKRYTFVKTKVSLFVIFNKGKDNKKLAMEREDLLRYLNNAKQEKYSEIIQCRVSKELKEEVFNILHERNISLSTILRSYLHELVQNQKELALKKKIV
jgi:hypothetical protein